MVWEQRGQQRAVFQTAIHNGFGVQRSDALLHLSHAMQWNTIVVSLRGTAERTMCVPGVEAVRGTGLRRHYIEVGGCCLRPVRPIGRPPRPAPSRIHFVWYA